MSSLPTAARYGVLVPVKPPSVAKSRLASLGDEVRTELAAAFALDTVDAALACREVARVLVVTDDFRLAAAVRPRGADVVPDGVADDLNATLVQAAAELARRDPQLHLAALCADLPALRPEELGRALSAAPGGRTAFVADASGTGTTLLLAPDLSAFDPRFGAGSADAHRAAGAHEVTLSDVPTLRRDVDTPDDLAEALDLGAGPRTSWVSTTRLPASRH